MKKFLCSIAILATVLGITSTAMAATFKDVKNTKYEEAVNILTELKIVNGYEDNTYKPNNSVKRSEMAKLIIVALGKEKTADMVKGNTSFSDVSASHWASGYINLASSLGLIKGYPEGTFKPDATVSYVEAATMLLRALDYGKELEGLSWPTGYMTKANTAGLLNNVTAKDSNDAAIRGNVATMILNTLKAPKRKVVASNSTGNVYGDGEILLEKTFSDMVYVKEGTVVDIVIEDEEITVKDEKNDRKVDLFYSDASEIKKIFGREVSFIYDKEAEIFLSFEVIDDKTVKVVDVDEIDEEEYVIIDEDGKEYDIPKSSNVVFVASQRYEDIEKAYLTFNEKNTLTHAVLEGPEPIYAGIVYDKAIKIGNKPGIEIINTDKEYEELVLSDSSMKIYEDDVILFSFDNSERIIVKAQEDVEDAEKIDEVTSTSIKLKDGSKITLTDTDDYKVFLVKNYTIKQGTLSQVDATYDLATILKFNEKYYIICYEDSIDPDDIETDVSVSDAKAALKTALTNAKKKSESSYSVVSFEKLKAAIKHGDAIYSAASSYSSAKIQLATRDINEALAGLTTVTTADKELRAAFSSLQTKIKEADALDKNDYTATSYAAVTTAVTAAKKITIASTTLAKVTTAKNDITSAINLLVTNASAEQVVTATNRLKAAITDAKARKSTDYTDASYKELTDMLAIANKVNLTTAGAREINNVASNLEAAIDALVPVKLAAYQNAKKTLDDNLKTASEKNESAYTAASWTAFKAKYDDVKERYDTLKSDKTVKELSNAELDTEKAKVDAMNKDLTNAINALVLKTDETLRKNSLNTINNCITKVGTYTEETWNETNPAITWQAITAKIETAKKMYNKPDEYTTKQLQEMAIDLIQYVSLS